MPANSDSPTHCLLYRAPDAERWRMFAYFDDLTEDGCEMLLKLCEYEFAPHFEELGDEFTAAWEPSEYEFKCIVQDGHVAKRSKLGSDMRELDRLTSRQKAFGGKEDVDTLILWNIAHKARTNKNQVHTVTRDVGKDGGSESGPEGPSYTATKAGTGQIDNTQAAPPFDSLDDPVACVWVTERIGNAAGRPDVLARKMRARNYPIAKIANKNYCQRKDAIAMFPRLKHRLMEQTDSEA